MDNPLVSIIIPTYNRAHLISETLDSILAQTYINWECIIVDDGSTDHTDEVLKDYLQKDSRFQYHHRPNGRPKGANACRNFGFELSKGEYVNWFDSDDLMFPNLLSFKINKFLENQEIDFVVCGFKVIFNNGKEFHNYTKQSENYILSYIFDELKLNSENILWKKTVIENVIWDENINKFQDLNFIFENLKTNTLKGESIEGILIEVRVFGDSISINQKANVNEDKLYVRKRMYIYAKKFYDEKTVLRFYHLYLFEIKNLISSKNYKLTLRELFISEIIPFKIKFVFTLYLIIYIIFNRGLNRLVYYLNKIST
ncbi:glycosyltransferase family 2 protein [Mariniflexile sp.]|uniref:glycosyltransferase family 2 protein n=1 Tax=Mariniflexile sp. TaxID=1979402 RepID=UPI003565FDFE